MMSYLNELLFGYYPYVAGAVFLLGSLIRFDRDQYTWRSGSSQLLRAKNMRVASNLFHVGILMLFVGHFVGLLTPPAVYHAFGLSTSSKQLLAVAAGGIFGVMTLVGLAMLLHRRMHDPRIRANSSKSDMFILWLLLAQLLLGLFTLPVSLAHADGSTMLLLADWAQRIVTFRGGAADLVANVNILFKLHLLLGITIFLVFPFTRLVHIWSAPVWYLGRRYQVVRQRYAR